MSTGEPSFGDLGVPGPLVEALALAGINRPTPVQVAVLPDAVAGRDVLARARTGSGKTLAFGVPLVARLAQAKSRIHRPRALVIVPTRELAGQVDTALEPIARAARLRIATVYGGTRYDRQVAALRRATDIVVATPGRLTDLIDKGILKTTDVRVTVLDEADQLCDLGFFPIVDDLLGRMPSDAQRLLLSATLDGDVATLVERHLREPRLHEIDPAAASVTTMEHHVITVGSVREKVATAVALAQDNPRCIVFTRTREGATALRDTFVAAGLAAVDLHGNLSQHQRERNLDRFAKGKAEVVVATDVAARGLHVDAVSLVVHFDPPTEVKAYLHRSGRTARAGEGGAVVTLARPRELAHVRRLHAAAEVEARQHDVRRTQRPFTPERLAASGTLPERRRARTE